MQRSVWSVDEIAQILVATNQANVMARYSDPRQQALARAYREGFKAALTCVALALGVPVKTTTDRQPQVTVVESSTELARR